MQKCKLKPQQKQNEMNTMCNPQSHSLSQIEFLESRNLNNVLS